jgi:hypothetical protein
MNKLIRLNELGRKTTHPRNEAKHLVETMDNETLGILKNVPSMEFFQNLKKIRKVFKIYNRQ